jgi:hypothetical protein
MQNPPVEFFSYADGSSILYDRGILSLYQQQTGNGMLIFVIHHFILDILCAFTLQSTDIF